MLKRNCPKCNKEITYANSSNYNRGCKSNALCYYCANETRIGRKRTNAQCKLISQKTKIAMENPEIKQKFLNSYTIENRKKRSESAKQQIKNLKLDEKKYKKWILLQSESKEDYWKKINESKKQFHLEKLKKGRTVFQEKLKNDIYKKEHVRKCICNGKVKDTKPELLVKLLLEKNLFKFEHPYQVDKKVFDFYIPEKNLLIETDGVYWHGKNLTYDKMNSMQRKHKINDNAKNELAKLHKYKLLRIWEDEIDENTLLERISNI